MAEFRKILISGSNVHVKQIKANLSQDSNTSRKVVVYDNASGIFYHTGSYQNAGTPPTFPGFYDGDISLTVTNANPRNIKIGTDRSSDGSASIDFLTVANTNDPGLSITRGAGLNAKTEITHSGNEDFIIKLTNPSTTNKNSFTIVDNNDSTLFEVQKDGSVFTPNIRQINTSNTLKYDINTGELAYQASSRKFKKNIKNLDPKIIKNFDKLRPVSFAYLKDPDDALVGGFIAEEIAEINPLLAEYGPNYKMTPEGEFDENLIDDQKVPINISDRALLATIVAKIQELDKKIQELKKLKQDASI